MIKLNEMAKIGSIDTQIGKTGSYEIWIYTNDPGNKPHFHIKNEQTGFSSCIKYKYIFHNKIYKFN